MSSTLPKAIQSSQNSTLQAIPLGPTEPAFIEHCITENTVLARVLMRNRTICVHEGIYYWVAAHMIIEADKSRPRRASDSFSLSP